MSAYDTLAAICDAAPLKTSTAMVSLIDLLEVLHELETFRRGGATKPAMKYSAEFEEAWTLYPSRPGMSKAAAFKAWTARMKAGATALEMIEGTRKYAIYCKSHRTEPEYIKQPATFYGPGEHFTADWTPRRTAPLLALVDFQRENNEAAMRILRGDDNDGMVIDATP